MIYTVTVSNHHGMVLLGNGKKILITAETEVEAISEAVIRSKCDGLLPTKDEPGGEFYLNWLEEMREYEDAEDLKEDLLDQGIIVEIRKRIIKWLNGKDGKGFKKPILLKKRD